VTSSSASQVMKLTGFSFYKMLWFEFSYTLNIDLHRAEGVFGGHRVRVNVVEGDLALVFEEVLDGRLSHLTVIGLAVVFETALHVGCVVVSSFNFCLGEVTNAVD
jgi:hypothetical protein